MTDPEISTAPWRKSTFSDQVGNCVEVARPAGAAGTRIRDSKHPAGPVLSFTEAEWSAFRAGVAAGEFD